MHLMLHLGGGLCAPFSGVDIGDDGSYRIGVVEFPPQIRHLRVRRIAGQAALGPTLRQRPPVVRTPRFRLGEVPSVAEVALSGRRTCLNDLLARED
jgi:hypothetical protein